MSDVFKVGAEMASFDGVETPDVAYLLELAREYRARKAEAIDEFHRRVAEARKQAEAAIAAAHEDTRRALLAAREAKTDG